MHQEKSGNSASCRGIYRCNDTRFIYEGKTFSVPFQVLLSLRVLFVPVLLSLRDNQGSIIEIVYVYTFNGSISLHAEELARKLCSFVFQYYKILVFLL